jgi:acetoin utilization protein AcuB
MRLAEIMSTEVRTISSAASAEVALETMARHGIHHLVVLEPNKVIGVLSHRDLGPRLGPGPRQGLTVGDLMARPGVTARPDTSVRDAANLLRGRGIGCLPVIERGKLVGIVTTTDLLELIGRGLHKPASRRGRVASARKVGHAA